MTTQPLARRSPVAGPDMPVPCAAAPVDSATPPHDGCGTRRRGPSADKTAQTQRQITEAALAQFVEQGIARSTMAQIAERAGVGKGTIYSYYPSKDALLRGVVQHGLSQSVIYQPPVLRRPGESVQSLLRRSLLPSMEAIEHSDRGRLARLILSEATTHPALGQLYKELAFDPWMRHMQQLLALALAEGELVGDAVADYTHLLCSPFWMGMVHNGLLNDDPQQRVSIRPLVERLIALLFKPVPVKVHP